MYKLGIMVGALLVVSCSA
jgi:hypothetical protein